MTSIVVGPIVKMVRMTRKWFFVGIYPVFVSVRIA